MGLGVICWLVFLHAFGPNPWKRPGKGVVCSFVDLVVLQSASLAGVVKWDLKGAAACESLECSSCH